MEVTELILHFDCLQMVQSHIVSNPESDSLYQMTNDEGSGSGSSPINHDWNDDEDGESDWPEQGSGSGDIPSVTDIPGIFNNIESGKFVEEISNILRKNFLQKMQI